MISTAEIVSPLTQTLLGVFPHPAMIINRDRQILSANLHAIEAGAEVGGLCWQTFGHAACLSDEHKMLSQENPSAAGISCTFCRADKCLDNYCQENDPAVQAFGKTLDTYWIAINNDSYLHYAIDVTEHEGTKALLRCVLDSANDLIYFKDLNSTYVGCNKASEEFTGIAERDQIGKTDFDFFDREIAEIIVKNDQKVIASHTAVRTEEWVPSPVFGRVLLETVKAPIYGPDGKLCGLVGISRDITERKQAEKEREALIEQLQNKTEELERFTYTVSHGLKSPLITIRGFVGVLEESLGERIDDDIRHSLDYINSAATKMSSLLDDLLRLSRLGKFVNLNERVELSSVFEEALNLIKGRLLGEKIIVKIADDLPAVTGDRIRLCELMQNLLENAIKYMGEQPAPFIEVGVTEIGGERACFVRDNGKGIPERYQAKVFGLFERVSTDGEGTGIGLSMVQRIIELHGGRVWVESTGVTGEGATFWFTLPWEDVQTGTPTS